MKKFTIVTGLLVFGALVVGCGTSNATQPAQQSSNQKSSTQKPSNQVTMVGATDIKGKANLAKYEQEAAQKPTDVNAQITAGKSAFANGDYQAAVSYYKKAIALQPKNVIAYNNLGNTYLRGLNHPKDALPYYQKATQVDPSYAYGWLNLADAQEAIGDKAAAKTTLQQSLTKVAQSDPIYKALESKLTELK